MTFSKFVKELNGDRVEGELIKTIFYSLITSLVILVLLYFTVLKNIPNFLSKYGFYIFFAALSYAIIVPAMRQVRAYKEMACMSGMMIGMTIGMISGFLVGFYVGATNGMFTGGMFGLFVGIFVGSWAGKCCGIMGVMEGIMAGFMGGLMGAMSSVMMVTDHLQIASIVVFIVSAVIMIGLNYMVYSETKETNRELQEGYFQDVIISAILISVTTWIIVYGPRSASFQ